MKKYFLLLFAVLLLGSCTKKLQISTLKQPVYATEKQQFPAFAIQPKTVISPVSLQTLPTSKMVLSSQNIYEQAYYQIRQMLQDNRPLSFKKAVYLTENAYFDNELPENSFNQAITDLVSLTKAVEKTSKFSYKYADSVNLRKNYAIYRVLADTLNIANIFQLLPYQYDFEDARGEKEWAKGFVTKLLATRTGNCHSLPFLYKILAEELETEAYLSLLPHHIYLQIPFKRPPYGTQTYFNTELTSKTFPLDAWVETAGYVSNAAVVSGMYMDRLDTKQSLALCLVDLAKGFEARNKGKLSAEEIDKFMQNCVNLALQTAPNLITARLLQVEIDKRNFVATNNKLIYKQLETNITKLFADGYLELPELMYADKGISAVVANPADSLYRPFAEENLKEGTPTGKGTVLTLSNGRYDEFLTTKKIETIGSVSFDTERKKIVGFGENKREVEVVSRFLSVDPIAKSYPELTPYQFASNSPIAGVDLDGLEFFYAADGTFLGKIGTDTKVRVVQEKEVKAVSGYIHWANAKTDYAQYATQKASELSTDVGITNEELNTRASLATLKQTEAGSSNPPLDYNDWNTGDKFTDKTYKDAPEEYEKHPGSNPNPKSSGSAAGAYQFLKRFYTGKDFSPTEQDKAALGLMGKKGVEIAKTGDIIKLKTKLSTKWVSLPHFSDDALKKVFKQKVSEELNDKSKIATPKGELLKSN